MAIIYDQTLQDNYTSSISSAVKASEEYKPNEKVSDMYDWGFSFNKKNMNSVTNTGTIEDKKDGSYLLPSASTVKFENILMNTWIEKIMQYLTVMDKDWLRQSISKSENYLIALQDCTEYRVVISSTLLIVRNSSSVIEKNVSIRNKLIHSLKNYAKTSRNTEARLKLMREMNAAGLNPAGA